MSPWPWKMPTWFSRRKAMPINRVQFQKGMSLGAFITRYGTEE